MEQDSRGMKWELWKFIPLPCLLHSPTLPLLLAFCP
ncbi:unnamed protein product, partial [Gulo gulo]